MRYWRRTKGSIESGLKPSHPKLQYVRTALDNCPQVIYASSSLVTAGLPINQCALTIQEPGKSSKKPKHAGYSCRKSAQTKTVVKTDFATQRHVPLQCAVVLVAGQLGKLGYSLHRAEGGNHDASCSPRSTFILLFSPSNSLDRFAPSFVGGTIGADFKRAGSQRRHEKVPALACDDQEPVDLVRCMVSAGSRTKQEVRQDALRASESRARYPDISILLENTG